MELSWRKAMEEKESREKHDYARERERERERDRLFFGFRDRYDMY